MEASVGVDLGATNVRAVVGDAAGSVLGRHRAPTPRDGDGEAVAAAVVEVVDEALAAAGVSNADVVRAAVAAIGPLDPAVGGPVEPANLDGVAEIPLVPRLEAVLAAPVSLHNDANAGAVGVRDREASTPDDLVYLTLSTGIGAGVVCDGRLLEGSRGNAGEVGHVTLDPDAPVRCGCGAVGHWEAFCGGGNIPAYARALAAEFDDAGDAAGLGDADANTFASAADVFAAAGTDPLADRVLERVGMYNAVGVATVVQAYDPELVVVGGAVARHNPEAVLDPIRRRLPDLVLHDVPEVRLTDRGGTAVVDGALACAVADHPGVTG